MALDCLFHFVRPVPVLSGSLYRHRSALPNLCSVPFYHRWWQGRDRLHYDFRGHVEFWRQWTSLDYFV